MSNEIISIRLTEETHDYLKKMLSKENESLASFHIKTSSSDLIRKIINWSFLENLDDNSMMKLEKILNNKTKKLLDLLLAKQQTLNNNMTIISKLIEQKYGSIETNSISFESENLKKIESELEDDE